MEEDLFIREQGLYVGEHPTFAAPFVGTGVVTAKKSTWREWLSPGPLTWYQMFYLFVLNSLGAMVLSAAANFGVACAMYRTTDIEITMWVLEKNTVAGDMGVTVIIQQIITMLVTSTLCHFDLRNGLVSFSRPWPPMQHFPSTPMPEGSWLGNTPRSVVQQRGAPLYMGNAEGRSRFVQFALWFLRAMCTGSERNAFLVRHLTIKQRLERIFFTGLQGLWVAVLTFWWYWPIAIAITAPIFEHRDMRHTWIPPLIKLIFGGVLGLLTNPFMAMMALGSEFAVRRFHPDLEVWKEGTPGNCSTAQQESRELLLKPDSEVPVIHIDK